MSVAARLASRAKKIQSARPNTDGSGQQEYPPAGDHECMILAFGIEDAEFVYKLPNVSEPQRRPGYSINIKLQTLNAVKPPASPEDDGKVTFEDTFTYPNDDTGLPENQQTRLRIQDERYAGFLKTMLGRQSMDAPSETDGLFQRAKAGETFFIIVKITARPRKNNAAIMDYDIFYKAHLSSSSASDTQ